MNEFMIDDVIKAALKEDINYLDITTDNLIPEDATGRASMIAKADGVVCGLDIAARVFSTLDSGTKVKRFFSDGDSVKKGDVFMNIEARTRAILKAERTALNLIQHLSGVATATAELTKLVSGTKAMITDTRKTMPSIRFLQKYAVTCGGGKNHRFNLSDAAMLKDNHIDAAGGITKAVAALKVKIGHTVKIEVETRNLDEVREALSCGADIIMLDNMSLDMMKEAVGIIDDLALTEASGGINRDTIRAVAETGVDIISVGALTHSVTAFDISLKFLKQ